MSSSADPTAGIDATRSEWAEAIGAEHVVTRAADLRAAETATFPTSQKIPTILRPADRAQVQACVRIAGARRMALYPVSSGFNWGYGSRVPASDACALLDLGRLDRIVDYDEDLAYVTIEPGVTQGRLLEFLRQKGSKLWLDATGSTPHSSLIGNTVERGFGHTPYGDHFAHVCGLEVVLPDGETVETGYARYPGAKAGALYRWGVGPSVDGLFSQSNLGIVTRLTLWLMPAPEHFEAFFFRCDSAAGLGPLIEALRPLRMSGVLRSAVHVGNDYKVLSGMIQYPWERLEGQTPLSPQAMTGFRGEYGFGAWNGSGGLYGSKGQVREARRLIRRALAGRVDKLQFLDERKLRLAERFAKPFGLISSWDLSRTIELVKPIFGLMKGLPTDKPLASAYWRKRSQPPEQMDPDRDGCGLLWCAPIAPFQESGVAQVVGIAERTLLEGGFEPMISLTLISERAVACVISLSYDRAVDGEDERAMSCYGLLMDRLAESGYHSYRLGVQSMDRFASGGGYDRLLQQIKAAVDPHGVLSPGRYDPS